MILISIPDYQHTRSFLILPQTIQIVSPILQILSFLHFLPSTWSLSQQFQISSNRYHTILFCPFAYRCIIEWGSLSEDFGLPRVRRSSVFSCHCFPDSMRPNSEHMTCSCFYLMRINFQGCFQSLTYELMSNSSIAGLGPYHCRTGLCWF